MMFYLKLIVFFAISSISINVVADSDIYVYPNKGQSSAQLAQDRYECHVWAAGQSGFDPSAYSAASSAPVLVASSAGGHYPNRRGIDPITGAAGGAALGALGGAIGGDAGKGAAIGAGVGALAGIFNSLGNNQRSKDRYAQMLAQQAAQQSQQDAEHGQDRANYERAISACLEAHEYTVK